MSFFYRSPLVVITRPAAAGIHFIAPTADRRTAPAHKQDRPPMNAGQRDVAYPAVGGWRRGFVDKAKFHYTDPTRTKSVHVVGYELNSTTRTRHGPDRTRTDFFASKLRWVRAGPVGSV